MKKASILGLFAGLFTALLLFTAFQVAKPTHVRHIVVFKYKPTATTAQIATITNAIEALKDKIPGIIAFEHGINNSPEQKNQGFTHVYQVTFKDAAARDAYLPHPEHKKFGELLGKLGVLEDAFVVDYMLVKK